jgi:hypothetical protein
MNRKKQSETIIEGWLPKEPTLPHPERSGPVAENTEISVKPNVRTRAQGPSLVPRSAAVFILFTLSSCLYLLDSLQYGSYILIFAILGWAFGLILGGGLTQWRLSILSKKGEYKPKGKTIFSGLIIVIVVIFVAVYFVPSMVLNGQLLLLWGIVDLLFSCAAAICAAETVLSYRWQRKHGKILASDGLWSTKICAFPRADKARDVDEH